MMKIYLTFCIRLLQTSFSNIQNVNYEIHKLQLDIIERQFRCAKLIKLKAKYCDDVNDCKRKLDTLYNKYDIIQKENHNGIYNQYALETRSRITLVNDVIKNHIQTFIKMENEIIELEAAITKSKEHLRQWESFKNNK